MELRAWLGAHVTPEVVDAGRRPVADESLETLRTWNRQLADARWAAPAWPVEHGGRAAGLDEQVAYYEEMDGAQAPGPINAIGVANIAPAIMAFGTDEQQARFLRPMLRGDTIWSQGMSEPDSGSDLASLRTRGRARRGRVRRQRPEDLEQPRPPCGLVPALRPDRPRRAQAPRHQVSARPAAPPAAWPSWRGRAPTRRWRSWRRISSDSGRCG